MTQLTKYLSEIQGRVDAATEGPWVQEQAVYVCTKEALPNPSNPEEVLRHEITGSYGPTDEKFASRLPKESANHLFIAHSRQDVEVLLAMVNRLQEQRNEQLVDGFKNLGAPSEAIKQFITNNDHKLEALIPKGGE